MAAFAANGEFVATFTTTRIDHTHAVFGGHTLTETVLIPSFTLTGLKRPLHFFYL
jgi:hypothetical protein